MTEIKEIEDSNFNEFTKSDEIVIVDFWATWCGPCKTLANTLQRHIDRNKREVGQHPEISFGKVNIEDCPKAVMDNNIGSVPTMLLYKDGELVARKSGALSTPQMDKWIAESLN